MHEDPLLHGDEVEEVGVDALPGDTVAALTELFGDGCGQRLLRGTYGITAFEVLGVQPDAADRRVCVFGHGMGQNYGSWDIPFLKPFVQAGYTVIAYSYYGHGWSFAGGTVMGRTGGCLCGPVPDYGKEIHLRQVEELLDHVMREDEPIDLWVGHSTGGIVGVLVAEELRYIRTFALVSPAFWGIKPCILQLERYSCVRRMTMNSPLIGFGCRTAVLQNNDLAFGIDDDGKYIYPEEHEEAAGKIQRIFEHNAQAAKAIAALSACFLRSEQFPEYRERLKTLLSDPHRCPQKMLLVWGTRDVVVPYNEAQKVVAMNPDVVQLESPNMGHESLCEDPELIANTIVDGLRGV